MVKIPDKIMLKTGKCITKIPDKSMVKAGKCITNFRNSPQKVFLGKGVEILLCNVLEITLRHGYSPLFYCISSTSGLDTYFCKFSMNTKKHFSNCSILRLSFIVYELTLPTSIPDEEKKLT